MSLGSEVSTKDLAKTAFANENAEVSTSDTRLDYLRRRTGATTYPSDFANRAYGQVGVFGTANPTQCERRADGPSDSPITNQVIYTAPSGWPAWKVENYQGFNNGWNNQGAERAINGWFFCCQPGRVHRVSFERKINFIGDNQYSVYPVNDNQVNVIGFTSGYLSGGRTTYFSRGGPKFTDNWRSDYFDFTPSASYPYVVINVTAVGGGNAGYLTNVGAANEVRDLTITLL